MLQNAPNASQISICRIPQMVSVKFVPCIMRDARLVLILLTAKLALLITHILIPYHQLKGIASNNAIIYV